MIYPRATDNRSGVTVVDSAAIVLYAVPVGLGLNVYRVSCEIVSTAYTSGTPTYTVTWVANSVNQTAVVTSGSLNTLTGIVRVAMPDGGTNITAQLTGPFVATVRLSAIIEQIQQANA